MTFLNALLAFGAAAFTIPLIIHLLNRSKYLTIDWGAMQFLESSMKVNARRIQWKQLLLLLIRCMIPILLALAMARPIVRAWRESGEGNAMSLAVVLDDSFSMQSEVDSNPDKPAVNRESLLSRATREIDSILGQLPPSSSVCLILAGDPIDVWGEHRPEVLRESVRELSLRKASAGTINLASAVRAGADWLSSSPHPKRHLLVLSDFQASQWDASEKDTVKQLSEMLAQQPVPIQWSFLDVANDNGAVGATATTKNSNAGFQSSAPDGAAVTGKLNNSRIGDDVSILSMECVPGLLAPSGNATISASIQNHSKELAQIPVVLRVGLEEVERQTIQIGPQSSTNVRFQWSPKSTGDLEVHVVLDTKDRTPADNILADVIRVREPANVLVIDGDRRREAMKSESDYLRLALTPFSLLRGEPGDLVTTRVVDSGGWNEAMLKEFQAVVCCNIPDLNPEQRRILRSFADAGGGLVICLGDKVQTERWNTWESVAAGGLRPGKISPRVDWSGRVGTTSTPLFELSRASLDSLETARFEHRHTLELETPNPWTGIAFEDSQPWLVAFPMGQGRCVWMMSSCDDGDSNLPSRPAYVPLMQKLLAFVLQTPPGWREIVPGEPWREEWKLAANGANATVQVLFPDDSTAEVPWATDSPGKSITLLPSPRLLGISRATHGEERRSIATQLPVALRKRELNRERLTSTEVEQLASDVSATPSSSANDWLNSIRSSWGGKELWTWFWLGLLVMFLAEMYLQQSMNARLAKTAHATAGVVQSPRNKRGAA
jgi:hypothetical protein